MPFRKGEHYTGVAVVFICHDGKGNYLLAKRSRQARDERERWDSGGGAVEFADGVEDTLRKEIAEEYCTDVLAAEFLGFRDVHRVNDDGRPTHWIALDFKVFVDRAKAKIGEPHKFDDIGWFALGAFPAPLHSQFPKFLEAYKGKL